MASKYTYTHIFTNGHVARLARSKRPCTAAWCIRVEQTDGQAFMASGFSRDRDAAAKTMDTYRVGWTRSYAGAGRNRRPVYRDNGASVTFSEIVTIAKAEGRP